ncbi:MAG TPA: hypothetical protein VN207_02395 [Ktedonobacteraceae bacterium]|nr:hypothetical protein [Ktedonobacteraceae bacterium]
MKIISWNCNMAYAKKQKHILALQPDIAIIQECSEKDIKESNAQFYYWVGNNPHKGLGVLGFDDHTYSIDSSYTNDFPWFIPLRVKDMKLNILAIWAHKKNQEERYVRITNKAVDYYKSFLEKHASIVIGDFNSNTIWDKEHLGQSHSNLVKQLEHLHLRSIYHYQTQEKQGDEKTFTLYMYRHPDKGYHIDYAFLSKNLLDKTHLLIPDSKAWLRVSDHIPLILDISLNY